MPQKRKDMEHLSLEIFDRDDKGSQYAYLAEDASITFTDTSEIFSSGDVWSFPFSLNTVANAKIFGTSGEMHGSRLHEQLNGRRARVWVDGLPLYLGYLKLDSEVDVNDDGNVDVTFESGQKTFDELIEGGKANQVPMLGEVQFGMALWRKRWTCMQMQLNAELHYEKSPSHGRFDVNSRDGSLALTHEVHSVVIGDEDEQLTYFISDGEEEGTSVQLYPRMVFPKGTFYNMATSKEETVDFLNTDSPYDDSHPYCNIALCYQKYGYTVTTESNGVKYTHEDYSSDPTAQRGYEVMPANRVNSAPNFFVIYWLKALMTHLGIHIDENQMMDIEDLRRLFFVNTNCAYEETKYLRDPSKYTGTYGRYQFGSKGPLVSEYFGDLTNEKYQREQKRWNGTKSLAKIENCGLECISFTEGAWYETKYHTSTDSATGEDYTTTEEVDVTDTVKNLIGGISSITITPKAIAGMSETVRAYYDGYGSAGYGSNRLLQKNLLLHRAIASSECFPDEDISTVIDALESGFGIRFLFDKSYKRVRIVLLKNIFRSSSVQNVVCDILGEAKTENCIRGFKMTYGDSEDTTFYYKGLNDLLPHKKELWVDNSDKHDYSYWNLNAKYTDLLNKVSAFDKTCYIEPATGNAYGIKVDEDAKRYDELYPSLFEFAGFMDAEDGDCTGEDETIETIEVGFKPAIMNDVNYENERNPQKAKEQHFALFVDETMRPRRPDLNDLPNNKQPGVKSYDDSDAVYSTDKLYELHGNNGTDVKMVSDGVVAPGSFAVASDMYVEKTFPSLPITAIHTVINGLYEESNTYHTTLTNLKISGHISEGYRLYLQDNFEVNDDGVCPIESHEWGLTLGIMRGSGSDAYVDYANDPQDEEGNDTWSIVPGSGATAHPDICNSYGELWDYNGTLHVSTSADAKAAIEARYPTTADSILVARSVILVQELADAGWTVSGDMSRKAKYFYYKLTVNSRSKGYVTIYATPIATQSTESSTGKRVYTQKELKEYILDLWNKYAVDLVSYDANKLILAVAPSDWSTLAYLRGIYFGYSSEKDFDNGVGATDGRFSLKLRAEKLNPYYVKGSTEEGKSNQYLPITTDALKGRGLMDKFYKEYSYWTRNARIVKLTTRMTLAQFLAIDKTERVRMGDYLGFIKKMEFSVSNKTGFGNVTVELMYI